MSSTSWIAPGVVITRILAGASAGLSKLCGTPRGTKHTRPGRTVRGLSVEGERHRPGEHVERLVVDPVHMRWRPVERRRQRGLEDREVTALAQFDLDVDPRAERSAGAGCKGMR